MVWENGAHVVIFLLSDASSVIILVHDCSPVSDIPHVDVADSVCSDFANGSHVVMVAFSDAWRVFIV